MIELLTADTPNGKKISIMLEETKLEYKVTKVNLYKDEQFKPDFRKISPFSKIPVIIDYDNNKEAIFESGAILIYLGEKTNKFYDKKDRLKYIDKTIYEMTNAKTVLDTSMGWGDRLTGFFASNATRERSKC